MDPLSLSLSLGVALLRVTGGGTVGPRGGGLAPDPASFLGHSGPATDKQHECEIAIETLK